MTKVDPKASRTLVLFVRNYTDLLEQGLKEIHAMMRETVDGVMKGINEISDKTAEKKRAANEVLVGTYTNPDDEARATMDAAQDEVDRVLNAAHFSSAPAPAAAPAADDSGGDEVLRDKLRRSSGIFSKHMEALETLDGDLQTLLMSMMGALSRDDVISQRVQHIQQGMHALQAALTYVLTDYESRCKDGEIDRFIHDVKVSTFKSYTMEEEKQTYYQVFPEDKPKKKKVS